MDRYLDNFFNMYFVFKVINFKNVWNTTEYQQVQKRAFKTKSSYFGIYIPHTLKVKDCQSTW